MNWTLEVVVVPVSDVDRAKTFYAEQLGFHVDHDTRVGEEGRVVQLTPPGSGCSVVIGNGAVPDMPPGSLKGLQLVVSDVRAARAQLVERGVAVSEVQLLGRHPSGYEGDVLDNVGFIFFNDPDGNGWAVQQISSRGEVNAVQRDLPNIGKVARRELATAGYTRLEQLTRVGEAELAKLHGVGPKALLLLRAALAERGLSFADERGDTSET